MVGVDLYTISTLLGNKTPGLAARYSHLSDGHQQAAVERLTYRESGTTGGTKQEMGLREAGKSLKSLVRPTGLEPATQGLGNPCSIHLSYGRLDASVREVPG